MATTIRLIATQVYPSTVPLARLMIASLRKHSSIPLVVFAIGNVPNLEEQYRVDLNFESLVKKVANRPNPGVNDLVKAIASDKLGQQFKEMLYIDADCLVLGDILPAFNTTGDIALAMERHDNYIPYLRNCGSPRPNLTFNGGVVLFRKSFLEMWHRTYDDFMARYYGDSAEGQAVWNVVWHTYEGNKGVLPQSYNQLHVRNGPFGAVIYHMAGLGQNMKETVMRSCYRQFIGEPPC